MKKKKFIIFLVVSIVIILFLIITPNYVKKENSVITVEKTEEVAQEQMLQNIELTENLDSTVKTIKNDDLTLSDNNNMIIMKQVEYQYDDLTIQMGAYFDVDKQTNLIYKTLFAWARPLEKENEYTSFHITELASEYPTSNITIRTRGTYHNDVKNFDLYLNTDSLQNIQ